MLCKISEVGFKIKINTTLFLFMNLFPIFCQGQVVEGFKQQHDKIEINLSNGILSIYPLTESVVRIKFYKDAGEQVPELIFNSEATSPEFQVSETHNNLRIEVKNMIVEMDKQSGKLSFADKSGKIFLSEKAGSRKLVPDSVMGEPCFLAEQSFESPNDEFILGLGQFQDGHYNLKGVSRRLTQVNSQISLPFIYSSKGYGLLWHQYGLTDFNPADNFVALEKQDSSAGKNKMAEVTTTTGTQKVSQDQSLYFGTFKVPVDGEYSIFLDLGDMDNRQYVVIDGEPCIDMSNFWLPPTACALVDLEAGEHQVQLVCKSSNTPKVSWKLTDDFTTFRSPNAKLLDYVVFYGPSTDNVIAAYRNLSGNVPMLPGHMASGNAVNVTRRERIWWKPSGNFGEEISRWM